MEKNFDISVIVTCHSEGILLHKTLASIDRATKQLVDNNINFEIIIHVDEATDNMDEYLQSIQFTSRKLTVYTNNFCNLGLSRNFAVDKSRGKFVSFVNAGNLISGNWLINAYKFLSKHNYGKYIASAAMTVEFGDVDSITQNYDVLDKTTDTLLSVSGAHWGSAIVAPRTILLEHPYLNSGHGYGYEDWFLDCTFIENNICNVVIPETVMFVRRKCARSESKKLENLHIVLRAHPLLSFKNFRCLNIGSGKIYKTTITQKIKKIALPIINTSPTLKTFAGKIYHRAMIYYKKIKGRDLNQSDLIPIWLTNELKLIHSVEKGLFPTQQLINSEIHHNITPEHYNIGLAYKALADFTHYDKYDYIIFVPWLVKGGADMFAINYANTIADLLKKNVLVIATDVGWTSTWQNKLNSPVDFMPFGGIAGQLSIENQYHLLEQIVENSGARVLHILNSALGYDFILNHQIYLLGSLKKVVVTSFSQSIDKTGRIFGFSHTHVPRVYDLTNIITTDNRKVSDMWQNEYGFDHNKIAVHHQPVELRERINKEGRHGDTIKILWAARLAPEKQPDLVGKIANILLDDPRLSIDMYGEANKDFDISFISQMPNNVSYRGPFDGFFSLPLQDYDMYLYTTLFDGMPNTILEAAQSELPIISSAIGGIPEFIINNETGILVEDIKDPQAYANAIKLLVGNTDLSAKLRENAYEKLKKDFSADSYRQQVKEMLDKLVF